MTAKAFNSAMRWPSVFKIDGWIYQPGRRGHRFRCQGCRRIIQDGSSIVVEKRGKHSHGYHAECFNGDYALGALAREFERNAKIKNKPIGGHVAGDLARAFLAQVQP